MRRGGGGGGTGRENWSSLGAVLLSRSYLALCVPWQSLAQWFPAVTRNSEVFPPSKLAQGQDKENVDVRKLSL